MTILIANIGTSDLAIQVSQPLQKLGLDAETLRDRVTPEDLTRDYFLPIGFDRNEPNLKDAEALLTPAELLLWQNRNKIIYQHLYPSCSVDNFRDFTQDLLEKYSQSPEKWHALIRPGRLWGIVKEAHQRSVKDVYIFVTDQLKTQEDKGYQSDTIYLFELLKLWVEREYENQLTLHKIVIPQNVLPINQDGLLGEYYNFFKTLDADETILISVKGGTPQMQTALRVQAISSDINNQIYLEPQLSIQKLLAGEASDCETVSYWRYQRVQKYQIVKKLLRRWDFDGAREILAAWLQTLEKLKSEGITNLESSTTLLESALKGLQMGIGFFNLDTDYAKQQVNSDHQNLPRLNELKPLVDNYPYRLDENNKRFPKLLNLYTQCCLLYQTDRLADFLTRMGSFYEETLHELIYALGGAVYFDSPRVREDWYLETKKLIEHNQPLAQAFYELESQYDSNLKKYLKLGINLQHGQWIKPLDNNKYQDVLKLPGRSSKLNFVQALVQIQNNPQKERSLTQIVQALKKLDYWYFKRNKVIHAARGISKAQMQKVLEADRQRLKKPILKTEWFDPLIKESVTDAADSAEIILDNLSEICRHTQQLMETPLPPSINNSNSGYLDSSSEPYYLYSDLRQWIIQILDDDEQ